MMPVESNDRLLAVAPERSAAVMAQLRRHILLTLHRSRARSRAVSRMVSAAPWSEIGCAASAALMTVAIDSLADEGYIVREHGRHGPVVRPTSCGQAAGRELGLARAPRGSRRKERDHVSRAR